VAIVNVKDSTPILHPQRGVRSMDIFHSDPEREWYLQFVKEEALKCGIDILAWCLMTNHVHFIAAAQ
jgi:putative transposase